MENDPAAEMLAEGGTGTPPATIDYQKLYEQAQAQIAIQTQQTNQALALAQQQHVAHLQSQNTITPPAADPFAAFAPETQAALKAVTENLKTQFNTELTATKQQLQAFQINTAIEQIATKTNNPALAKRAQEIYAGHAAKGLPLTQDDAVKFAIGEAVANGTYVVPQRTAPNVITGGSRQPANTQHTRPANFEYMSRMEQNDILEREIGDAPIGQIGSLDELQ